MQESRLFKILYCLLEKGHSTAGELAKKCEVSVRTIYRDLDALSGAGIPVYAESGRNGGIRLMNGFVLDRAMFSEKEKQEILAALQNMAAVPYLRNKEVLEKLSGVFRMAPENWLEVDFTRWGGGQADNEKFAGLRSAVLCRQCVRIRYAGSNGAITKRVIHPLKLFYKAKEWYVKAYCTEKEGFRLFKLTRILELEILEEKFPVRSFPEHVDKAGQEYRQITLLFPGKMAYRVYDEFDAAYVERLESGELRVCARMPEDAWLTGFLLSCGTQVEIVEPSGLQEIVAQQARLIYEKYKTW